MSLYRWSGGQQELQQGGRVRKTVLLTEMIHNMIQVITRA